MKHAKIAELKARLSEYLRDVRKGHPLVVMDRNTPVARVVPYAPEGETLSVRRPLGRASLQRVPLPPPLETGVDAVELLLEERRAER
jgi:prevent-host-death family protein